jgi:hypothetical protein
MGPEIQTREQYEAFLRNKGYAPAMINRALATFDAEQQQQVTQPLAAATTQPTQPMVNGMQNMGGLEQQSMADRFQQQMVRTQPQMQQQMMPPMPQMPQMPQMAPPQGDLSARVQAYEADALRATEDRFARQREAIEKMYGGPSTSDTLFALSRALLAPRQFTGFGGTMGKIAGAFGDISQERQSAERKRAEALLNLESSYGKDTLGLRGANLDREIKLSEYQAKQAEAARKAAEPKIQLDQMGNIREVPATVARPRTRAEYDALPVGTYYVVPDGPKAGQIVPKT